MAERIASDRLVGERIGGRFVIERLIGSGPLSSAFRARDELLQRRVTVKLFHPQHADDVAVVHAQLELAKAVARLSHPNIVTVIDRGEHEGMPFVVLEYVRGENLQERIDRFAPLRITEVTAHATALARALAYAHAQDVVHGNLRPGNVLVSEDHEVKLVDFGGGSFVATLTGSDPYLAPELRAAGPHAMSSAEHDIYALGVLLFVALTETEPNPGVDAAHVQLLRPDVSPRLATVIARAMALDPRDRHGSMREFASDLATVKPPASELVNASVAAGGADPGATQMMQLDRAREHSPATGRSDFDDDPDAAAALGLRRARPAGNARQTRARIVAWSMVVLPVLALVVVAMMIAGERGSPTVKSGDRSGVDARAKEKVSIVAAQSFDPEGDNAEHDELIDAVYDLDEATIWDTETYERPTLREIGKSGVGFYVDLGAPRAVRDITFVTGRNGWTATIYGADNGEQALQLADWGDALSKPETIVSGDPIEVDVGDHEYRYYLVWITALALTDGFKAEVSEMRVRAAPE